MSGLHVDDLRAALTRKGFEDGDRRGRAMRMVRRQSDRHDHVVMTTPPRSWWRRLARQPRIVNEVLVGVLWPIGETAFSRRVEPTPLLPHQVHAATNLAPLVQASPPDPATVAAAADDWCRRLEDPAHALRIGAIHESIVRLEFATILADGDRGREALADARADVDLLPRGQQGRATTRVDIAERRLPEA